MPKALFSTLGWKRVVLIILTSTFYWDSVTWKLGEFVNLLSALCVNFHYEFPGWVSFVG